VSMILSVITPSPILHVVLAKMTVAEAERGVKQAVWATTPPGGTSWRLPLHGRHPP